MEISALGGDTRPLSYLFLSKSLYSFIISYFSSMARVRGSDECCPSSMLGTVLKTLHSTRQTNTTSFYLKAALFNIVVISLSGLHGVEAQSFKGYDLDEVDRYILPPQGARNLWILESVSGSKQGQVMIQWTRYTNLKDTVVIGDFSAPPPRILRR